MRFVAIGDSFTEGVGDGIEGGAVRGWADLVAAGLAAGLDEPVDYANLAIRGRLIGPIVGDQLEPALALSPRPDVLAFNGGGNDMMRPGFDRDEIVRLTEQVVRRTEEEGVRLLLQTGADATFGLPRGDMMRSRVSVFTDLLTDLQDRYEHVTFVDNFSDEEMRQPGYWDSDRLHLNALGHRRVAARALTALGVPTELPSLEPGHRAPSGVLVEARYYATYVLPWIGRRLTGRSSGDGRSAKFADWVRIDPS
ncbi:SGNH/GDSL hydrolase family protein [Demequina sp. NBRC 110057]|uniref:SGNH/GDSL hydrolase family protein n=1 Tax=Demequina sp. NBRC 110057 TaxID=1570346 RepID=UPI000A013A3C|nr:SGNH/GDSL hydrolase family protein [Demequina sp. NBRC 110057]